LARRYGDDLAVLWIDSHPDIGTPASRYPGWHAVAVAALTGHGDADLIELLPATVCPDRVALVGLHEWTEDDFPNVAACGIHSFGPDQLRASPMSSPSPSPSSSPARSCTFSRSSPASHWSHHLLSRAGPPPDDARPRIHQELPSRWEAVTSNVIVMPSGHVIVQVRPRMTIPGSTS
jgi:hypothetical protein